MVGLRLVCLGIIWLVMDLEKEEPRDPGVVRGGVNTGDDMVAGADKVSNCVVAEDDL